MSFLLRTSTRIAAPIARLAAPISQRTFSTTLRLSITIDSDLLSQITAAEKTLTNKDGPITDGPTARVQKHVGQQLTSQIIHEITEAEKAITGSSGPTKGGPTAVAQGILTNEGGAGAKATTSASSSNSTSNASQQHTGKLDSSTIHEITEAEKNITGQEQPVQGGPTAKAQQHANEPITSEALHDITEGEKKITGG